MKKCAFFVALCLMLSGCSYGKFFRARELSSLDPIETLCVDISDDEVVIHACGSVRDRENVPVVFRMEGRTVDDAVEKLKTLPEGKDALFIHTKNLVLSEEYCRARRDELAQYLRDAEDMRPTASLFLCEDAEFLLRQVSESDNDISSELEFLADHTMKGEATTAESWLSDGVILRIGEHNGSVVPLDMVKT